MTSTAAEEPKTEEETTEEKKTEEKKTEEEEEPSKDTIQAVKERLRFFFSDANLRQDSFMRRYIWKDDGNIPIEVLLKFNSLKEHTTSVDTVLKVAKELPELLVSEGDQSIKRAKPFLRTQMNENVPLSLYITGLKVENDRCKASTRELKELFDQYDGLMLVKLCTKRVDDENDGKHRKWRNVASGAALVEFDTVESLNKAAHELLTIKENKPVEPKRVLELCGVKLDVQKFEEYKNANRDDNKRKFSNGNDSPEQQVEESPIKKFEYDWKPGCVIQLKGLSGNCDREAIMAAVAKILEIDVEKVKEQKIFADYSRGQTDGAIRFQTPDDVPKVVDALKETEIAGAKVESAKVLEGHEEKESWDKYVAHRNEQLKQRAEQRSRGKKRRPRY